MTLSVSPVIRLGLESTEYEPEKTSGLIYRPSEAIALLYSSHLVVSWLRAARNSMQRRRRSPGCRTKWRTTCRRLTDKPRDFDETRFHSGGLRDTSDYTLTRRAPMSL